MKHTKRMISLLIATVMLIGLLPIGVFAASAPTVFYWTHTNDPEGWYSFGSISFAPVPGIDVYQITLYKNNKEVYSFTSWWDDYDEDIYVATHLVSEIVKNGSGSYTFTVSSCDEEENILATTPMSSPIVYTEPTTKLSVPRLTQNRNGVIAWNEVANATEYYFELDFICDGETFLGWSGNLVEPCFDTELIDGWELDIPPGYTKNDVSIYFRVNASPWDINEFSPSDYTDWVIFNSGDLGGSVSGGDGSDIYADAPTNLKWHNNGAISFTPAKDVLDYTITLYKDSSAVCDYNFSIKELEETVDFGWFQYKMVRLGQGRYSFAITPQGGTKVNSGTMYYNPTAYANQSCYMGATLGDTVHWVDEASALTEFYTIGFYLSYDNQNFLPITYRSADKEESSYMIHESIYEEYRALVDKKHKEDPVKYNKYKAMMAIAVYTIPKDPDTWQIGYTHCNRKYSPGRFGSLSDTINWKLEDGTLTITGTGAIPDTYAWMDYGSEITKVVIGSGITSVGSSNFSGLSKLTSVTLPDTLTEIDSFAFSECLALEHIDLPESLTAIGVNAFYGSGLKDITLPDKVTTIPRYAFYNCKALKKVTFESAVQSIADNAFDACYSLTDVYWNGSKSEWEALKSTHIGVYNDPIKNARVYGVGFYQSSTAAIEQTNGSTNIAVFNLNSVCEGKTVLCGLYLNGVLQDIVSGTYTEEGITLSSTATAYDEIKVMVWNSLSDSTPVSNGETITAIGGSGL